MKEIVNRLHENKQIELAKSILEANGYQVTKKEEMKESTIPGSIKDKCIDFTYFTDGGFSEEEIESYRTQFEDAADALGVSVENVLCCSEEDGDAYEYLKNLRDDSEKLDDIMNVIGIHMGLYKSSDGVLYVYRAEFGYETFFFVR